MKRFKAYIAERVAWQKSATQYVFSRSVRLPISPSIWRRLFGAPERDTVFHVFGSSTAGNKRPIEKLAKLQGKKKSISAYTEADRNIIRNGVNVGGGLVAEMEADILIEFPGDVMSEPDKTGRRWISISFLPPTLKDKLADRVIELRKELIIKHFPGWKDFPPSASEVQNIWSDPEGTLMKEAMSLVHRGEIRQDEEGQVSTGVQKWIKKKKSMLIADYIDGLEREMKANAHLIKSAYLQSNTQKTDHNGWNELVVNKIDIKHLHILRDTRFYIGMINDYFPKEKTWVSELETNPEVVKAINRQMMKLAKKYRFQYTYYDRISDLSRRVSKARRATETAIY